MRRIQHVMCAAMSACLVFLLVQTPTVLAQKGTITCESFNNEYHHCYADTKGRVTLKQQLSSRECRKGSTWGFDDTGVWVDRGCRAEFEYGRDQGGSHAGRNAAIAAGGIGAAIAIGMIISSRKDKKDYDQLSDVDKTAYHKGWDLGTRDAKEGRNSDYTRYRSDYESSREAAFKMGYNEGFQHGTNKQSSTR